MDKRVQAFLQSHRISALSILQDDSSIHAATLHYAHQIDPLQFLFMTEKKSQKCQSLLDGSEKTAALVIGFSEEEFSTFQAEGKVKIITDPASWDTYITKFPSLVNGPKDSKYVLLAFTPMVWKYSDMRTDPITRISSSA